MHGGALHVDLLLEALVFLLFVLGFAAAEALIAFGGATVVALGLTWSAAQATGLGVALAPPHRARAVWIAPALTGVVWWVAFSGGVVAAVDAVELVMGDAPASGAQAAAGVFQGVAGIIAGVYARGAGAVGLAGAAWALLSAALGSDRPPPAGVASTGRAVAGLGRRLTGACLVVTGLAAATLRALADAEVHEMTVGWTLALAGLYAFAGLRLLARRLPPPEPADATAGLVARRLARGAARGVGRVIGAGIAGFGVCLAGVAVTGPSSVAEGLAAAGVAFALGGGLLWLARRTP